MVVTFFAPNVGAWKVEKKHHCVKLEQTNNVVVLLVQMVYSITDHV